MDEKTKITETRVDDNSWQMEIEEFDANGCLINGD